MLPKVKHKAFYPKGTRPLLLCPFYPTLILGYLNVAASPFFLRSMMFLPKPHPDFRPLPKLRVGVVGTGFIVRECHLVAYQRAGIEVCGIVGRDLAKARHLASQFDIPFVANSVEELLAKAKPDILDIAVPPLAQPMIMDSALACPHLKGILAQKPLAMSFDEATRLVDLCQRTKKVLSVNQNMRFDPSVYAQKQILQEGILGEPVLATIDMRAVPHWMDWAKGMRSLSTWIMSIHHLDTFRYWLGTPDRVFASFRKDPRTQFDHIDGINLYILEYENGPRASAWDDVWAGPVKEGGAPSCEIRWRFEGTKGVAKGTLGWPEWPKRTPSTLEYSCLDHPGVWVRPQWEVAWFPDAFVWPMADLMEAIDRGTPPFASGMDNLETIALLEAVLESGTKHTVTSPQTWLKG